MHRLLGALGLLCAVACGLGPDYSAPGPYPCGTRTIDIPGAYQLMRHSLVCFPDSAGTFPKSAIPAPIIVFAHGWMMGIDRYFSYAYHLATRGFVVVMPTYSDPTIIPQHDLRARLVVDAARYVSALDTVPGDRFYGALDRWNWGFAGHSMGASIVLLAADRFGLYDTLRAIVAVSGPPSTPRTRAQDVLTPTLLLFGQFDRFAPWKHARNTYWQGAHAPATFAALHGANHGYSMDHTVFWQNGGHSIYTRDAQKRAVRRYLTAYFERYLHGDTNAWNREWTSGDSIRSHTEMESVEVRSLAPHFAQPFITPANGPAAGFEPDRKRLLLRCGLPEDDSVLVAVYVVCGNRVRTLLECRKTAGAHAVAWDGKDDAGNQVSDGVYVVGCTVRGWPIARCEVIRRLFHTGT